MARALSALKWMVTHGTRTVCSRRTCPPHEATHGVLDARSRRACPPRAGHRSTRPTSLPLKRGMLHYAHSRKLPVQVRPAHAHIASLLPIVIMSSIDASGCVNTATANHHSQSTCLPPCSLEQVVPQGAQGGT